MYKLLALVFVSLTIRSVYSYVAIYPPEPVPEKYAGESGCYLSDYDVLIPYGESYEPESDCGIFDCFGGGWMNAAFCGASSLQAPPECEVIPANMSLPYPDCCKLTWKCPPSESDESSYESDESSYESDESSYESDESSYESDESSYESDESSYESDESSYESEGSSYESDESSQES